MSRPVSRRVFISYSHESREHVERVRRLYELLRANGVDARADFTAQELPQDWGLWTEEQVTAADRILVVTSAEYRRQASRAEAEPTGSGVRYEAKFLRDAMVRNQKAAIERFLLVLLPGISDDEVPRLFEGGQTRYRVDPLTGEGVDRLLRVLTDQPGYVEPDLGTAPTLSRDKPVVTVQLRLVVERRDGRHDLEAPRILVAAACEASGTTARDLGLNAAATRGDVPVVSNVNSPLGKWLRALHQEVYGARGAVRVRVVLAVPFPRRSTPSWSPGPSVSRPHRPTGRRRLTGRTARPAGSQWRARRSVRTCRTRRTRAGTARANNRRRSAATRARIITRPSTERR
jgi:hypothetical protein